MKHHEIEVRVIEIDGGYSAVKNSQKVRNTAGPIQFPALEHAQLVAEFMIQQAKAGYPSQTPPAPAEPKPPTQTTPSQSPQTGDL